MRVLLVGPDHEDNLSIRYLSAALHEAGHVAELAAFNNADDQSAVVEAAAGFDAVGLSMCFQSRAEEYLSLADALKRAGCPLVIMGGHYATCEAEALVSNHPSIDVIVVHEGERTLIELVEAGPDRSRWRDIAGVVFVDDGTARRTAQRRAIEDLDTLPTPDRRGAIHLFAGVPTAYLLGSRGCVASCDYCCIVTLHEMAPGKRYRRRDPERVVDEMAALYHERGIRQFIFHDDNFLVPSVRQNHARIDAFERALARHGMRDIGFAIKCRPADAERSVFERLKAMGLLRVFFGIESASEEGLRSIGRDQTVAESARALELSRELDISSQYTLMMFHPDATLATVRADLAFMQEHIEHALNFCRTEIYAGTPLERRMIAEGRARGDYLARNYRIADAAIDRACDAAIDVFEPRCWVMGGLMERVIGLDHLDAVVGRFYTGPGASRWRRAFAAFRRRVNDDLHQKLSSLVEAAAAASSLTDPSFLRAFDIIRAEERTSREALEAECASLQSRLDDFMLAGIGARRDPVLRLVPDPPRESLMRHAAAVALAFSVAAAAGCSSESAAQVPPEHRRRDAGTHHVDASVGHHRDAGTHDGGHRRRDAGAPRRPPIIDHDGICEYAAPPLRPRPLTGKS